MSGPLKPDVITGTTAGDGRDWHPVLIMLRRDDAGRLAIGLNMILRAVREAIAIANSSKDDAAILQFSKLRLLAKEMTGMAPETRRAMAEVALALDVRLVSVPNQKGAGDLRAQSRSERYRRVYTDVESALNPSSVAFGEEPGSLFASCGHRKFSEAGGRWRCAEMVCNNYYSRHRGDEHGAAQPAEDAD